jgi:hypothetical protein
MLFIFFPLVVVSKLIIFPSIDNVTGSFNTSNICASFPENIVCEHSVPWLYTNQLENKWTSHEIYNLNDVKIASTLQNLYQTSNFSSVYNNSVWYGEKFSCGNWLNTCGSGQITHPTQEKDSAYCGEYYKVLCLCNSTVAGTHSPSTGPTNAQPSKIPTIIPSKIPTTIPSKIPTTNPSKIPTTSPSKSPTTNPSKIPTTKPSKEPTINGFTYPPSNIPTKSPSRSPSVSPTKNPTIVSPSSSPSVSPTKTPTKSPSRSPSVSPTKSPTIVSPSGTPTKSPTIGTPSVIPSLSPNISPTSSKPSNIPSKSPSKSPTLGTPSNIPSISPTQSPTLGTPSNNPSQSPTQNPTLGTPSRVPTRSPTKKTNAPTNSPTTKQQYVSVERTDLATGEVELAELQIFLKSAPNTAVSSPTLTPSAAQSSDYSPTSFLASVAVDGVTAGVAASNQVAITSNAVERAWWRVLSPGDIFSIRIWPRTDACCRTNLVARSFRIRIRYNAVTDPSSTTSMLFDKQIMVLYTTNNGMPMYPSFVFSALDTYLCIERTASPTPSTLDLTDVYVYMKSNPTVNIIANSLYTKQDSEFPGFPSTGAVDANTGTISVTANSGSVHYWNVYLGALAPEEIDRIVVYYRTEGASMVGSYVRVRTSTTPSYAPTVVDTSNIWFGWQILLNSALTLEPHVFIPYSRETTRWTTQVKTVPGTITTGALFGKSVAKNQDDTIMVVGSPNFNSNVGAFWVYRRYLFSWVLSQGPLAGSASLVGTSYQGTSVDIWGNTIVVGGYGNNADAGRVWVYQCVDEVCTEEATLFGSGAVGKPKLGTSVAIYGDTIVMGGPADNSRAGAVWVFVKTEGEWIQEGSKLTGTSATAISEQGASVTIYGDTLAFGGNEDNSGIGAIWVFTRTAGVWTQQEGKKTANTLLSAPGFGISISLYEDTLVVGGKNDNNNLGAAFVFIRITGSWSQYYKLVGSNGLASSNQGTSVSIWGDTIAVGGPGSGGITYIYRIVDEVWREVRRLIGTGNVGSAQQGSGVCVRATTVSIGGMADDSSKGAVWSFWRDG